MAKRKKKEAQPQAEAVVLTEMAHGGIVPPFNEVPEPEQKQPEADPAPVVIEVCNDAPQPGGIVALTVTLGESRAADVARLKASCEAQGVVLCVQYETESRPAWRRWDQAIADCRAQYNPDAIILVGDDAELLPGCVEAVAATFAARFPDFDGVVGINQTNIPPVRNCTEYGFVAVGRAFLDRFEGHPLYCPDYHHFYVDTELGMCAKALGKFAWVAEAKALHHHRGLLKLPKDEAYNAARTHKAEEDDIWRRRKAKGLVWGISFDRLKA